MTAPVEPLGPTPSARLDALRDGARPGSGDSGDGAGFELLLQRASRGLVDELPAGPDGAAWRNWQRPAGALGARPGPSNPAIGLGGLSGATTSSTGPLAPPAGATGAVFPVANSVGQAVVNAAAEHLGVPYKWGGTDPVHGFDCSGLVQDAYRAVGVELPKWSRHQATMGVEVSSIEQALPGDILTFGDPVNHVALYVGDGRMLHAPQTGEVVKIEEIDRTIGSIRRVVTPTGPAGASGFGAPIGSALATSGAGSAASLDGAPYRELFESAGRRWNVDPALLAAVARTESGFDPGAVSPAGAQGLMQFMPATASEMGVDPWDPASAIDGAARYLRNSLDRFGSAELAIASYNAGPGAVARFDGVPPYPETQNYVRKVLDAWRNRS